MSTPADSCRIDVTVREMRPAPTADDLTCHAVLVDVAIGPMRVDGVAFMTEGDDGQLEESETVAQMADGSWFPPAVGELLADLGSNAIRSRCREAIRGAVQAFDREAGVLGDGPEYDGTGWAGVPSNHFPRPAPGTREWDDALRVQYRVVIPAGVMHHRGTNDVRPA